MFNLLICNVRRGTLCLQNKNSAKLSAYHALSKPFANFYTREKKTTIRIVILKYLCSCMQASLFIFTVFF